MLFWNINKLLDPSGGVDTFQVRVSTPPFGAQQNRKSCLISILYDGFSLNCHTVTATSSPDYCNDPMFSDRQVWANSVDPDQEQSDQGLHCLPSHLHLLDALLHGKSILVKFKDKWQQYFWVSKFFRSFTVLKISKFQKSRDNQRWKNVWPTKLWKTVWPSLDKWLNCMKFEDSLTTW